MNPKSGKPVFVNPFSLWTHIALKSGGAMLEAAQAAVARPAAARPTTPRVAVIHNADAPAQKAKATPKAKVRSKAKGKKRRAKR